MNSQNHPPVFVPDEHWKEIENLSKAALMDMVWDYAQQISERSGNDGTMAEFRNRRSIILSHRRLAYQKRDSR